uniref:Uncharacterized protein n=1 Tax=Oncorhynchus tshawytscha TaxID=74940 RepID=A0AAZ3RK33_ONCTS
MDNWGRRGGKEASGQREETASHNSSPFKDEIRNADVVLFSNFSSPEYIMELWKTQYQRSLKSHYYQRSHTGPLYLTHTQLTVEQRDSWRLCPDSHVGCQRSESPCRGTSSAARRPRRSTPPEPPWSPLATSPSSLGRGGRGHNSRSLVGKHFSN